MKRAPSIIFLLLFSLTIFSQTENSVKKIEETTVNLYSQILVNPQEKIYLQTDRPYYIMGEKIYFRSFLIDAAKLAQATYSRYIYVELISPFDEIVVQNQIRLDEKNMFYGTIQLPEFLPEGEYLIRAYTRFMENAGDDFFFKRKVYIANPNSVHVNLEQNFRFTNNNEVLVDLQFTDAKQGDAIEGKEIEMKIATNDKLRTKTTDTSGKVSESFKLDAKEARRTLLLSYKDGSKSFSQYIHLPFPDSTPELLFFPEGGQLVSDKENLIAFKALLPSGNSTNIKGEIIDSKGEVVTSFITEHEGMGSFSFTPKSNEKYHAKVNFEDNTFDVDLPEHNANNITIHASWLADSLQLKVLHNQAFENHYLFIHKQGVPIYFEEWNSSKGTKSFEKEFFKTGVSHVLLLNENMKAVSERFIFNNLHDEIKVQTTTDKSEYKSRELIKMQFALEDYQIENNSADFAVSIIDSNDIIVDKSTNIMAELLLVSELKGNIKNPAWYFSRDENALKMADLLMLSHGWRRYNTDEALIGNLVRPKVKPEVSHTVAGSLKKANKKPVLDGTIKISAVGYDYTEAYIVDDNGRFLFDNFEFPDNTAYQLIGRDKNRSTDNVEVHIDPVSYPALPKPWYNNPEKSEEQSDFITGYIEKATQKYIQENGMLFINLDELIVSARKREKRERLDNQVILSPGDRWISPTQLEEDPPATFMDLFYRLPGVQDVTTDGVKLNAGNPKYILDGIERDYIDITSSMDVSDIAQVDIYTTNMAVMMRWPPPTPVIILTTWPLSRWKSVGGGGEYIKNILPMGYQLPDEFYAPKYDTAESLSNTNLDLRSTIYWVPNMLINENSNNSIEFYSADKAGNYTVVIEGIAPGRKLIHSVIERAVEVKK